MVGSSFHARQTPWHSLVPEAIMASRSARSHRSENIKILDAGTESLNVTG
jgi:hypothetical protein